MEKGKEQNNVTEELLPSTDGSPITERNSTIPPISYHVKTIAAIALPIIVTTVSMSLQMLIAIRFVGNLGDVRLLGGYSLGTSWATIFAFAILTGIAAGLDTLVSQNFGKGECTQCGHLLYRGMLIVLLTCVPCILLMWLCRPILLLIGMDELVAEYSSDCAFSLIPVFVVFVPQVVLEKYLLAQQIALPQMVFQGTNLVLYPLYCYFFISVMNMGYLGTSAARLLGEIIYIVGMLLYIKYTCACEKTWVAPSKEMLQGWKEYMHFALPAMLMICLEWWGFELTLIVCGRVGVIELGANTIALNYAGNIYFVNVGVATATGVFVGNSIGKGNVLQAKIYTFVGLTLSFLAMLVMALMSVVWRETIANFLCSDERTRALVNVLLIFASCNLLCDGLQGTLGKVLIGLGRQKYSMGFLLFSYYCLMIPIAYLTTFPFGIGVYGLWLGALAASTTIMIGYSILLLLIDWNAAAKDVSLRIKCNSPQPH